MNVAIAGLDRYDLECLIKHSMIEPGSRGVRIGPRLPPDLATTGRPPVTIVRFRIRRGPKVAGNGPRGVRTQFQQSEAPPSLHSQRPLRARGACSSFLSISRGRACARREDSFIPLTWLYPRGTRWGIRDQQ